MIYFLSLGVPVLDIAYKQNCETRGLWGWLLSLSLMLSGLTHGVVLALLSFFMAEECSAVCVSCVPFIHSFASGLSLPLGDCVSAAAVSIHVQAVVHKYAYSVAGDECTCFQFFGEWN